MRTRLATLAACTLAASCQAGEHADPTPTLGSVVTPSASQHRPTVPTHAPAPAPPRVTEAPLGPPFEVRPMVQVKHRVAERKALAITAEPGVLLGPKRRLVKAFDCTSPGAPRSDMFGICVGFKSCDATPPTRAEVLAEITCTGPELTLQLIRHGAGLAFRVADPEHPLAKRALTPIALPEGTRPEILPFERRNVTNYVDL